MKRNLPISICLILIMSMILSACGGKNATDDRIYQEMYPVSYEPESSDIYVEKIDDLPEDFIRGVDISSVLAQEESGVVYKNENGDEQDIFQTLAESGVNYVRVRVWNDPYDSNGNGYGGGNCDAECAAEIGKRAAQYGMNLNVDFHYSDFWADPNKQMCPKDWEGMEIEKKSKELYKYTKKSLKTILDSGAQVRMVQLGNEINNGMSGEKDWGKIRQLLQAGTKAVREIEKEYGREIQIAIHFTDLTDENIYKLVQKLEDKEIDYDILAVSYYPFWHGTMENMTTVLTAISDSYNKQVMVVENSYPYTTQDGDGTGNSVSGDGKMAYPVTVQGQADQIRDCIAAIRAVGDKGIGYFYWEPAWIPVGSSYESNQSIWEKYGSGWASSYASEYDPKDAGIYYGGSSWDNQALFDYDGKPLGSLNVFKYIYSGTDTDIHPISVEPVEVITELGDTVSLPDTVTVVNNDRSTSEVKVQWDENQISGIDTTTDGTILVKGTILEDGFDLDPNVSAEVTIQRTNLLSNGSFEEADISMYSMTGDGYDIQTKASDAYGGEKALHFWKSAAFSFAAEQTLSGLEPGTYRFGLFLQGGDVGDKAEMKIYAKSGSSTMEENTEVSGWVNWHNPEIDGIEVGSDGTLTVGISVSSGAGGWGTADDWYLYQIK